MARFSASPASASPAKSRSTRCSRCCSAWLGTTILAPCCGARIEKEAILELQLALAGSTMAAAPLVQVDDLHWADDATLEAIPYLVERLQDFPVRWQLAARVGYDGVTAVYHRLRQAGLAAADTLGPLSDKAIAAIIDAGSDHLDPEERTAVIALAAGNPLYAQLLTRASSLRASSVARAARDHVVDLPEAALAVASALAVLERPLDTETLSELTAMAPRAVSIAVDVLLARGLVEIREGVATIRHQLLGDAILDQSSPDVIKRVHAGAARIVTDPEQRARHLLAAGESSESRATFARLGWTALDDEEWETAARCFAEAIALEAPDCPLPLERTETLGAALRLTRRIAGNEPAQSIVSDETWSRFSPAARARLELAHIKARLFESPSFDAAERERIASLADSDIEPAIAAELLYQCFREARYRLEHDAARVLIQRLRALVPSLTATSAAHQSTRALRDGHGDLRRLGTRDRGVRRYHSNRRRGTCLRRRFRSRTAGYEHNGRRRPIRRSDRARPIRAGVAGWKFTE